ncbi:MAG: DNA repair protein RadC [Odoribacter sp.]
MMEEQYLPMKSWAEDERPREKLLQKGVSILSLNELFAILLRSGVGGESAVELARRILADNNNDLNMLAKRGVRELMNKYKGVGVAKAASIVAAMEIGRRRKSGEIEMTMAICCSRDVYHYIRSFMIDLEHEEFWVIYLSHSNRVKGCECLSSGGMQSTVIDVRILFRNALDMKVPCIIIAHNHPGGTLTPSNDDKIITRKIAEGGALLDIKLYDHIIIGGDSYFSFADEGLLNG